MVFAVDPYRHLQQAVHRFRVDFDFLNAHLPGLGLEFHPSGDPATVTGVHTDSDSIAIACHKMLRHIVLMGREA